MSDNLYSAHWYRVAKLKPKLHSHVEIHRHAYRGMIWYVMEDTITGRNHRFNPIAYKFIAQFDGKLTVQEIHDQLNEHLAGIAPGQEEIINLLGQLHGADLIQTDVLANTEALFERQTRLVNNKFSQRLINPISQKLPLWDPEDFLDQHLNKVRWIFSPWMGLLWLVIIVFAALQGATNWPKIANHFDINALEPYNYLLMFLLYPPVKILHELGHAFAAKLRGGEVHEMGINFMMFMPVPYVDVSNSSNFRNKYDRMLVSAAGILVETFIAALGLLLFLTTEAGMLQTIGFNIMLIGGVSSLFFNGNPLLKYDGYYLLADALDIPNLFQRSAQFWRYFFQRYLLGLDHVPNPAMARGETFWFVVYSLASLLYRLSILWFICVYVTGKFFSIGVLLALWLVTIQILVPIYKALCFVFKNPSLGNKRNRAAMATISIMVLVLGLVGFMPIPSYTLTEGVVWVPDEAQIKAEQDGFIKALQVNSNQEVGQRDIVLTMYDDALESKARMARAKFAELQGKYRSARETDLVMADILKEELHVAQSELEHVNNKMRTMTVKTSKSGQLILPEADDLPGRYLHHGELIGYILDNNKPTIRMAVTQDNIGQLRERLVDIKVRLTHTPSIEYDATLVRQTPEATNKLPSPALATIGGGKTLIDPKHEKELLTLQKIFLVDLKLNSVDNNIPIGTRAFVRIDHGGEPLSSQWYRRIRQAFLRQFNV